jgi:hypothetical protein
MNEGRFSLLRWRSLARVANWSGMVRSGGCDKIGGNMDWLKTHVYLASWASPCIAIIIAIAKSRGKFKAVDWHEFLGLFILCTLIAVVLSPAFDEKANFARDFIPFLFGYGVLRVTRRRD